MAESLDLNMLLVPNLFEMANSKWHADFTFSVLSFSNREDQTWGVQRAISQPLLYYVFKAGKESSRRKTTAQSLGKRKESDLSHQMKMWGKDGKQQNKGQDVDEQHGRGMWYSVFSNTSDPGPIWPQVFLCQE